MALYILYKFRNNNIYVCDMHMPNIYVHRYVFLYMHTYFNLYVIGTHSKVMGGDSRHWSIGLAMTLHFLSALDLKNISVHGNENIIK